jgi:steroid 5-alpha reductase family enzyme
MKTKNTAVIFGILIVILAAAGLAWAGSQYGLQAFHFPLFALCVVLIFLIQWLAFLPAFALQTEKFFDITGSITYIVAALAAVLLGGATDARSILLLAVVLVWAVRLGYFLFTRIQKSGKDNRFDAIKPSFLRFLQTWTLQGLWISFTLAAALAAITSQVKVAMDAYAWIGLLVWGIGISIEAIADAQKKKFRKDLQNKDKFIHSGLWAWSRHPNYFGEILLWVGVAIIAFPVLYGWQLVTLISPLFVALLLTCVSGIPLLERSADKKWGGQTDYETYKASTPVLLPLPPRKK